MKRLLSILMFSAIILFSQHSIAQRTGLLFSKDAYEKVEKVNFETLGWGKDKLPKSANLKQWTAKPGNQGDYGTCVGWSTAYGALTLEFAKKYNMTDRDQITLSAFCPYYLYNGFKEEYDFFCQTGGYFEDALAVLSDYGAKRYYLPEFSCYTSFDAFSEEDAKNFRIENYYRLWDYDEFMLSDIIGAKSERVNSAKQVLAKGHPVLIGAFVPESFLIALGKDKWTPTYSERQNSKDHPGHAMTLIGYDDNKYDGAFLFMNSWGSEWGNDGYIWVTYEDFDRFVHTAFYLEVSDSYTPSTGCVFGDCYNDYSRYAWSSNETYEGTLKDGLFHGYGIYNAPDGSAHAGAWKDGLKDGKGVSIDTYGYTKTGYWTAGEYVGTEEPEEKTNEYTEWGSLFNFDEKEEEEIELIELSELEKEEENEVIESIYESLVDEVVDVATTGCVEGDCENGFGKYIYSDGDVYVGQFKSTYRHGFGEYTYHEGDYYKGEWVWSTREGLGKYIWPSGNIYVGEWDDNAQNGLGVKFVKNGDDLSGEWKNGSLVDAEAGFGFASGNDGEKVQGNANVSGIELNNSPKAKEVKPSHNRIILKQNGFGKIPKSGLGTNMPDPYMQFTKPILQNLLKSIGKTDLNDPPLNIIDNDREVAYINSKGINVSTKFIDLCKSMGDKAEAAMAYVLAHEIGHKEKDHFFALEFGSAYASTDWGNKIRNAYDTIKHIGYYETEADEFGLFFSYNAGYNTLDIAGDVIDRVYASFSLPDDLPGYPPKSFRKEQAVMAKQKVEKLIPVFEVGNLLNVLSGNEGGDYRQNMLQSAQSCYQHIINEDVHTIEVYNNLGVSLLNEAMMYYKEERLAFALPIDIDFHNRLYSRSQTGSGKGPGGKDDEEQLGWGSDDERQELFEEMVDQAMRYFEKCLQLDRGYIKSYINIASAYVLLEEYDEAWAKARKALKLGKEANNLLVQRNAVDLLGLIHHFNEEDDEAMEYMAQSKEMNSPLYGVNYNYVTGEFGFGGPAELKDRSDVYKRPDFNDLEKIDGVTLSDISLDYFHGDREIETWNVDVDAAQIGKAELAGGNIYMFVKMNRRGGADGIYAFYEIENKKDMATKLNVKCGQSLEEMKEAYSEPAHVVSGNRQDYYVYYTHNIIFKVNGDQKIEGWIVYDIA